MARGELRERYDVVVIGAGPSGLALAIEAGRRGVSCLVAERHDRVGYAPRAKTTHTRTREHLRRWGIAGDLAAASPFGVDDPSDAVFATRLNGTELARFADAFRCAPKRDDLYAEHAQWVPQYKLEEVLRRHAEALPGVEVAFGRSFVGAEQDADGVRVRLEADGAEATVEAGYLVGADGARSAVRSLIGATMQGRHGLSENTIAILRAPGLAERMEMRRAVMYWLVNADAPAVFSPLDVDDVWSFAMSRHIASEAEALASIDAAAGFATGAEILQLDHWSTHALVADRYRDHRIFLVGDACHLHPPYGGFGMNMGIGDGVDLGWKLAAVLRGWGGAAMLDSYEAERRPVHARVIDEAEQNGRVVSGTLVVDGLEDEGGAGDAVRAVVADRIRATKEREFRTLGVVLGARYGASPIIVPDGSDPPPDHHAVYTPNAVPGSRAPHLWLGEGTGRGASLFDHLGPDHTLLVLDPGAAGEAAGLAAAAARAGVPLAELVVDRDDARHLYGRRLAIVRPDQHVAWRGDGAADADAVVARLSGRVPAAGAETTGQHGGTA